MTHNSVQGGPLNSLPLAYRKAALAKLLGIHPRTIERLLSAGQFPRPDAQAGRCPLWRPVTIERWLDAGGGRIG
jgi:predicted DNA-binding transcriptional regulator AlpA